MNNVDSVETEEFEKILLKMKDIQVSFLNTQFEDGVITRPMIARFDEADRTAMYFISGGEGSQVDAMLNDKMVSVSMSDKSQKIYIVIKGKCTLTKSKAKIKLFWNSMTDLWFPKGLENSDVSLIKMDFDTLECWDSSGNLIIKAIDMLVAKINKRPPEFGTKSTIHIKP